MYSCQGCTKPIQSDGLVAMGWKWHPECFVCKKCSMGFKSNFLNVGGVPYHAECSPDDVEVASSKTVCGACKELVGEGQTVRVANVLYHHRCWVCQMCSQPFAKDDSWDTWEGMLAHSKCMPNPVCAICRKPIENKTIIIDGKTAHEDCMKCWTCQGKFEKSYVELDGKYYHEGKCVPQTVGHLGDCPLCNKELCNPAVEVEGKQYHKDCFACAKCHKAFVDVYSKSGGKFYHKDCI